MEDQAAARLAVDRRLAQVDEHDFVSGGKLLFQHVELAQVDRHRQHADHLARSGCGRSRSARKTRRFSWPVDVLR